MKTKRTVIAACIATLFISGTVFAKDSWEYHESGWNNVKSYGKVTIAQDSVGQWGPWEDFVEPAAGAPAPVAMPGMSGGDQYRNNPDIIVIPEDKGCAAGAWCGYAIFKNSTKVTYDDGWYSSFSKEGGKHVSQKYSPGLFTLWLNANEFPIPEGGVPGNASWSLDPLSSVTPTFDSSGSPIPVYFGGGTVSQAQWIWKWGRWIMVLPEGALFDNRDDSLHHFVTGNPEVGSLIVPMNSDTASVSGFSHGTKANEASSSIGYGPFEKAITGQSVWVYNGKYWTKEWLAADPQVAVGEFERKTVETQQAAVENYAKGYSNEYPPSTTTTTTTKGYYVAGVATPAAYLAGERAGNVNATYFGGSFDGSSQGIVELHVQFGAATWDGNWTGPMDFHVAKGNGKIDGAKLFSNTISGYKNGQYSGKVEGTIYGQQAGSIGGSTDVTRTVGSKVVESNTAIYVVNRVPTSQSKP
ncbi:HupA family protein [Ferribacterium limneticum]|jgi:hypothetical protein|uniref:hypothetical protein n=1 Tax=Ferribacterium limneticum TaxID=76259 RepID=UPI001CFAD68A|nr:hypothetical protein [Ferribacterium limneticum]UCV27145.1 hypothetical protein KI617_12690 [Ferribacterium limneticum]UCV31062.1 hypothetical protein KI608_12690 [Ferribacterium limneticum]